MRQLIFANVNELDQFQAREENQGQWVHGIDMESRIPMPVDEVWLSKRAKGYPINYATPSFPTEAWFRLSSNITNDRTPRTNATAFQISAKLNLSGIQHILNDLQPHFSPALIVEPLEANSTMVLAKISQQVRGQVLENYNQGMAELPISMKATVLAYMVVAVRETTGLHHLYSRVCVSGIRIVEIYL